VGLSSNVRYQSRPEPLLMRLAILVFALVPHVVLAQATTIEEPEPRGIMDEFGRLLGIHHLIGDLRTKSMADSALELRFWSIGWSSSGLRLQRAANGDWLAQRIIIGNPHSARIDSIPLLTARDTQRMDSMWNALVELGVDSLPTHVPRKWMMVDGHRYIYELRRGQVYRAVMIEHVDKPEVPADDAIKRIARVVRSHFPFLSMPVR
jgi:hypothetical protein